jgi:iron complex outermembrane receptor protein
MKRVWGSAGLAGFLLATTSCWGQAAPAPAVAPAAPGTPPKQAIEEVVVTAQLRSQKIQKVPISINAFSAAFIKQTGSQNLGDLQYYTPGLSVDTTSTTQPTFSIRGVKPDDFGVGTDPAVGIYVDGFYSARSGEALVFFDDVSRVEVLKGPQGTLFGRNTAAGAISIITNKPTDQYEATFDEKLGNYGKTEETVMVNIPVTDTFSVRVDGLINRRSGYLTNDYNGDQLDDEHNESARVAARWQPSNDTDVIFAWDHDNTNIKPPTALGIGPYAGNGGDPYAAIYDRVINGQESRRLDDLTLTAKHDFDNFTLTSLSGYKFFSTQNRESETGSDIAARYFDTENVENNHSFYQELRANGVWGDLTWVGGVSYYQERAKQQSIGTALTNSIDTLIGTEGFPPVFAQPICNLVGLCGLLGDPWQESMNNLGQYNATSVFGDMTYAVTPALNITVGARFTDDNKKFSWQAPDVQVLGAGPGQSADIRSLIGNLIFTYPGTAPNILPQGTLVSRSDSWTNVSPRFVVDYHWTDDVMTYASATYGYKAGGFNSVEIDSRFEPEKIQNYELGLKSDWLNHTLRVNLTGYYYQYSNFQSISLAAVQNSIVPQYVTESGDLEGKGADLEVIWLPVRNLTLTLDGGYVDSTWQKFLENETTITNKPVTLSLAGQPTGEPELRVVNGVDYLYSLGQNGNLRFHATNSFTSAERRNADSNFEQAQIASFVNFSLLPGFYKSHDLTDARLTWSDVHDHYEVAMYAQNLFDNIYVTDINYITATTLRTPYVRPEAPRFWGAELTYKF